MPAHNRQPGVFTAIPTNTSAPQLPAASAYGEGPAWVDGRLMYSNGSIWLPQNSLNSVPSVAAIGHSMIAQGQPSANALTNTNWNKSTYIATQTGTTSPLRHSERSIMARASMRSAGAWKMHYFNVGIGGADTQFVYENALPTLFEIDTSVPSPDFCFVLSAGNSAPASAGATANLTIPTTYTRRTIEDLLSRGVIPIICADPPRTNALAQAEMCLFFEKWAFVSQNLAKEYDIPWVDAYSVTVDHLTGQPLTGIVYDGTHLTGYGAEIVGYMLNQAVLGAIQSRHKATRELVLWDDQTVTYRNDNPNFTGTLAAGTINTAGSRPKGWSAPTTTTLGTVFNASGWATAFPTLPYPAQRVTPQLGYMTAPTYAGNVFSLVGDGLDDVFTFKNAASAAEKVQCNIGDKMALAFRVQWLPNSGISTNTGTIQVMARGSSALIAGFGSSQDFGQNDDAYPIGGTSDYPAGDFYQEFIWREANGGFCYESIALHRKGSVSLSNANDHLTISNMRIINLTSAGFL